MTGPRVASGPSTVGTRTGSALRPGTARIVGLDPLQKLTLKDTLPDPLRQAELRSESVVGPRSTADGPILSALGDAVGAETATSPIALAHLLAQLPWAAPTEADATPRAPGGPSGDPAGDLEDERPDEPGASLAPRVHDAELAGGGGPLRALPTVFDGGLLWEAPAPLPRGVPAVAGRAVAPATSGVPYKDSRAITVVEPR